MPKKGRERSENPILATHRAATHEYHLFERFEAGIVLTGTEVKSARDGRVSLKGAYAKIEHGEVFLLDAHISAYLPASRENADPTRARKLLLHAREIRKIDRAIQSSGMTLVPTRMYLKGGRVKVEVAIAKGKKTYDKREAGRREDARREMERARGALRL